MSVHHSLDIKPFPEETLYVNEACLSDLTALDDLNDVADSDMKRADNIRIYVPLDINATAIMRRISDIYSRYGEVTEDNELTISVEVGRVVSQLEIYDQIWYVRDGDAGNGHSGKATEIVKEMIQYLMEREGSGEIYPNDVIDELKRDYGLSRFHFCQ